MIHYMDELGTVTAEMLVGFFEGWGNPPSPATHLRILRNSPHVVLAIDEETQCVVGFINAISDGVLFAYIPLLEVLPGYRRRGIGRELLRRMLEKLESLYAVDLVCDEELEGFYRRVGMLPGRAMMRRGYDRQAGHVGSR